MPTVVLLEDDPALRLMLKRMLVRFFDCTVSEASDGAEGLQLVRDLHPDLVFLDVHLPTMSGVEVLEAMRASDATRDIACIVITSENQRPVIERLVAGHVLDILLKPVVLTRDVPRLEKVFARLALAP